jgi:hypothetical protein
VPTAAPIRGPPVRSGIKPVVEKQGPQNETGWSDLELALRELFDWQEKHDALWRENGLWEQVNEIVDASTEVVSAVDEATQRSRLRNLRNRAHEETQIVQLAGRP